ncbi:MAG: hypothetical protein ACLFWM_09805 [Actinomycetota bacterium]
MSTFHGRLRVEGDTGSEIGVAIDLDGERMKVAAGDIEIADWSLDEIRVAALVDGFHVRAEGEEVVLEVEEDGRFAIDLGLKSAHPALRRRMSALLRDDNTG